MLARVVNSVLLICVGAVFGMIGTVAHQSTMALGTVAVPTGIAVALLAAGCLLAGVRLVTPNRTATLLTAIGLVATIGLFSLKSTGGSVLIPNNTLGMVWVFAPVIIAAVVVAWPRISRRSANA